MRLILEVWLCLFPWIVNMNYVTQRLNELPWLPSPKSAWALAIIVARQSATYLSRQNATVLWTLFVLWCVVMCLYIGPFSHILHDYDVLLWHRDYLTLIFTLFVGHKVLLEVVTWHSIFECGLSVCSVRTRHHIAPQRQFVEYFSIAIFLNILDPRQNGHHCADNIFKCTCLNENVWISIEMSLKLVPKGSIKISQHWSR